MKRLLVVLGTLMLSLFVGLVSGKAATMQAVLVHPQDKPMMAEAIDYPIPAQEDWTDHGPIFQAGELGEWDHLLWGAFSGTAVKKDGTYYLYYQGARDYDEVYGTVMWRAIGVATSPDGINFTKYDGNPVVTWFPNEELGWSEEGATSAAVTLDDSGEIVLYHGANTAYEADLVHADGRLATSADGLSFTDQGIVLDHTNSSVWGYGDELFPIIAMHDAGQWFVYYLPNGVSQSRQLGVAWGNSRDGLTSSSAATSGGSNITVWGMGGSARIGPDTYALFLNDVTVPKTEVRTLSLSAPNELSAPVETYQFDEVQQATVLLDEESSTWFMFYRSEGYYGVKTAPAPQPGWIELLWFGARGRIGHIKLGWETGQEIDNQGFNLYRATRRTGSRDMINTELIPSLVPPGSQDGAVYSYQDWAVEPRRIYYYWLEAVDLYGRTERFGPVRGRSR